MSDLNEDVDSEVTQDPWRRKATTTARYDLCSLCEYFVAQKPYMPGVRCKFSLRPDVTFEEDRAVANCNVFQKKDSCNDKFH